MKRNPRQEAYDAYNDEVRQCEEDLAEGRINQTQYNTYLQNLNNNLEVELAELKS